MFPHTSWPKLQTSAVKVKIKLSLCLTKHDAMKTYWGSGGIVLRILDLGISFTTWSLHPPGKEPQVPVRYEARVAPSLVPPYVEECNATQILTLSKTDHETWRGEIKQRNSYGHTQLFGLSHSSITNGGRNETIRPLRHMLTQHYVSIKEVNK
jgi:hypothetical protein